MKNKLLGGSVILILASLLCKVMGAVYRIPLSNILGAEGIGIYQMIISVFSLALIISSGGVSVAVSHHVAKALANNASSTKSIFLKGFYFSLITSIFFAFIFIFFAKNISFSQGNSLGAGGYVVAAFALVFASLISAYRGLYQGHQNMLPTAISQMIEQSFKLVFGLFFATYFVRFGLAQGVSGAFLGIAISELFALIYLVVLSQKFAFTNSPIFQKNRQFWKTNSLVTLSSLIIPLLTAFDSFFVVNILSNQFEQSFATALYGLQSGIVNSLINFPVVISIAVSLALLPNLSYLLSSSQTVKAKKSVQNVFLALLAIVLPLFLIFFVFAKEIFMVLYPSLSEKLLLTAVNLLRISSLEVVFIAMLQVSISALQSLDKSLIAALIMGGCGCIKILLTVILVSSPQINILGLAISGVSFYAVAGVMAFLVVKKKIGFSINLSHLSLCFALSTILAISFLGIEVYFESVLAKICACGLIGVLIYVLPLFLCNFLNIKTVVQGIVRREKIE